MKLDLHVEKLFNQYHEHLAVYEKLKNIAFERIKQCLEENHLMVATVEARVKTEESLLGKLDLKGHKYQSIGDVTDIVGLRVVTFYSDEVDLVSALMEQLFDIDWANSVDKRKTLEIDRFGYMSLHYICRIPEAMYHDPDMPQLNQIRFEVQIRNVLQHIWAFMYHDMGYKSTVEIPVDYQRNMNRMAGMLEMADEQFSLIRKEINVYRRNVQSLVASSNFDEVPLNGDTFRSYLDLKPFKQLMDKIAGINQAEIYEDNLMQYYPVLQGMKIRTLGDLECLRVSYSDGAYQLALIQLAGTGLDIVASSVALQNICIVAILKQGFGEAGIIRLLASILGEGEKNAEYAHIIFGQAQKINLI